MNLKIVYSLIALIGMINIFAPEPTLQDTLIKQIVSNPKTYSAQFATLPLDLKRRILQELASKEMQPTAQLPLNMDDVELLSWSPDGNSLLALSADTGKVPVVLLDAKTGTVRKTMQEKRNTIKKVAWLPGNKVAILGSFVQVPLIYLWDLTSGKKLSAFSIMDGKKGQEDLAWEDPRGRHDPRGGDALSPDGTLVASPSAVQAAIQLWDIATATVQTTLKENSKSGIAGYGRSHAISWSPDGTMVAAGQKNNDDVALWNIQAPNTPYTLYSPIRSTDHIAWSPDSTKIALTGYLEDDIAIYDVHASATKQPTATLYAKIPNHEGDMPKWSADGKTLYINKYYHDQDMQQWDVATKKFRNNLPSGKLSPDNTKIAQSNDKKKTTTIFDGATGKKLFTLPATGIMAWSPDSSELIIADNEPRYSLAAIGYGRQQASRQLSRWKLPSCNFTDEDQQLTCLFNFYAQ